MLLEQSIVADGCRHAILAWNGYIVDGHNRFEICQKHGIHFAIEEIDFATEQDVLTWIIQNQLGRRNVTDCRRNELDRMKKEVLRKKGEKQRNRWSNILSIVDKKLQLHKARTEKLKETGVFFGVMVRTGVTAKQTLEKMKEEFRRLWVAVCTTYSDSKKGITITDEQEERKPPQELSALECAEMAISYLERMHKEDPIRGKALDKILEWIRRNGPRCTREIDENTQEAAQVCLRVGTKSKIKSFATARGKSQGTIPKKISEECKNLSGGNRNSGRSCQCQSHT